jgi:hypothetical protein
VPSGASIKAVFRRVPGVVSAKRLTIATYRRARPLRPPVESPSLVAKMLVTPAGETFITGNGIAAHCRYVLNYDVFRVNEEVENDWWFCNPEFLEFFFRRLAPNEDYVLFTHNSNVDRWIDRRFEDRLRRPELVAWFATNVAMRHRKLVSMPLGIGNPIKCNPEVLDAVRENPPPKRLLVEASFDVSTNVAERTYCIEQTGVEPLPKVPWPEYFERLASAYFCISPNGNGIDCYRTWQALYLGTIPIVTRSVLTEQHSELPLIVLDDWSDYRSLELSPELYASIRGDWDPERIRLDRYLEQVRSTIDRLRLAFDSEFDGGRGRLARQNVT